LKKNTGVTLCLLILLLLVANKFVSGQSTGNDLKIMFPRGADGRIAMLNAVGQKVFNFSIDGITNKQQSEDFAKRIKSNLHVVFVNLTKPYGNNDQWKGVFVLDRKTKLPDFKKLLYDAGIEGIFVDGQLVAVEDLEILKTNTIKKPYNQN
jgi:hypothetical protein